MVWDYLKKRLKSKQFKVKNDVSHLEIEQLKELKYGKLWKVRPSEVVG